MTRYRVYILPRALAEIDHLPGHIRSRVRRTVVALPSDPKPPQSKRLTYDVAAGCELWRLRLDAWRVVYLINHEAHQIYVLTARRRPPYAYDDLDALVAETQ
jgi:mRNA interferase RelE/StbE